MTTEKNTPVLTWCPECQESTRHMVAEQDYINFRADTHAQDAFPYLTAGEREQFITGICPTCWDKMFNGIGDI